MPRKIRELIADLERAGFFNRGGKGSHRKFEHLTGVNVVVAGGTGDDAKRSQEKRVREAIKEVKDNE